MTENNDGKLAYIQAVCSRCGHIGALIPRMIGGLNVSELGDFTCWDCVKAERVAANTPSLI